MTYFTLQLVAYLAFWAFAFQAFSFVLRKGNL